MSNKIIVTGGLGYIGSHTCISLFEAGYTPIIIDNLSNSNIEVLDNICKILGEKIKFYNCDCRDLESLISIFASEDKIDGLIHFAALKSVNESIKIPLDYYDNNIGGLINILKCIDLYSIKRLIFSSSCTVYGIPICLPVSEKEKKKEPLSPYGWTKYIGEKIIEDWVFNSNSSSVILRYFNPIGAHPTGMLGEIPNGVPNNLVPYITQSAAGVREVITVFGDDYDTPDGTCIRDFIHVCDLSDAHVRSLKYDTKIDYFNIGTGRGYSVIELLDVFQNVNNIKINYKIGEKREGDVPKIWADSKKSKDLLGWSSCYTIEDSLRDSWQWEKNLRNID